MRKRPQINGSERSSGSATHYGDQHADFLNSGDVIPSDVRHLVRHFTAYRRKPSIQFNIKDHQYIDEAIKIMGFAGSHLAYRAPIRHFLLWMQKSGRDLTTATIHTVTEFTKHKCGKACDFRYSSSSLTKPIMRFILFLQFQHVAQDYGWITSFPSCCDDFRKQLIDEGVSRKIANHNARAAIHFIIWMSLNGIYRSLVTQDDIERFIVHECICGLGSKVCQPTAQRQADRALSSDRFLRFLEGKSALFEDNRLIQRRPRLVLSETMIRYGVWLREQRGLRPNTIDTYLLDLAKWLPRLGEDASTYSAQLIRDIALFEIEKRSPVSQSKFISAIRNYLRFCVFEKRCSASLMHVLISRRSYRYSSVPKRLEPGMAQRVIDCINPETAVGLRDRAILLLLAELGLRAAEVARIKLDDLDWAHATIRIDGKGGRGAIVPLTQRAGDAIQLYLHTARPISSSANLFLRLRRPYVGFSEQSEVSNIAHRALARCGLRGGSHVFRHTLATELLRGGRTIEDVATVLRHTSVQTTTIYAKVDAAMLQRLAVPWMGDRQ